MYLKKLATDLGWIGGCQLAPTCRMNQMDQHKQLANARIGPLNQLPALTHDAAARYVYGWLPMARYCFSFVQSHGGRPGELYHRASNFDHPS